MVQGAMTVAGFHRRTSLNRAANVPMSRLHGFFQRQTQGQMRSYRR